jgi:hypothetical protein
LRRKKINSLTALPYDSAVFLSEIKKVKVLTEGVWARPESPQAGRAAAREPALLSGESLLQ